MKRSELIDLLYNSEKNKEIYNLADKVRHENVGDEVHLRALIEFSNICKCHCKYCGIRSDNKDLERYRLSEEDIFLLAQQAVNAGYRTIVLQSGEDKAFSSEKICNIIKKIKTLKPNLKAKFTSIFRLKIFFNINIL